MRPPRIESQTAAFIIAAIVFAACPHAAGQEQAPTQSKLTETLTVCQLLANTQTYTGKTVTLRATFVGNFEFSALTDDSCQPKPAEVDGKHPLIQPHFGASSSGTKSPMNKRLTKLLKKEGQAKVTLVGIFIDPGQFFGHQLCCRYRLDDSKLVSVEPVVK